MSQSSWTAPLTRLLVSLANAFIIGAHARGCSAAVFVVHALQFAGEAAPLALSVAKDVVAGGVGAALLTSVTRLSDSRTVVHIRRLEHGLLLPQ